jgi:hypothetical protein
LLFFVACGVRRFFFSTGGVRGISFAHQYQQFQQENMFCQTCIKNQQRQLEELKAKKIPRTPPVEKKNRRTPQATKNNNVKLKLNFN